MKNNIFKHIFSYVKPYRMKLFLSYIVMFISTGISLIVPIYMKEFINDITQFSFHRLMPIIGFTIAELITSSYYTYMICKLGQKMARDIRVNAWDKVLHLKMEKFDEEHSGKLSSRVINDSALLVNFITDHSMTAVNNVVVVLGAAYIMFRLDAVMTLIMLLCIPVFLLITIPVSSIAYSLAEAQQGVFARLNGILTEILTQMPLVKAHGCEQLELQKGTREIDEVYLIGKRDAKLHALLDPVIGSAVMCLTFILCGIGAYRVSKGHITAGVLVAFILYLVEVMSPIQALSTFYMQIQTVKGATSELNIILGGEGEDLLNGKAVDNVDTLRFEDVCFSYSKQQEENTLSHISFTIEQGKKVALIGASGAGKTTIFSLIERFYTPSSGEIYIGHQRSEDISLKEWRNTFGYVLQSDIIMSGTIRENIIYGSTREVTDEEIKNVARLANIDEFIEGLPNQYETQVGERGTLLSGGQKQRIAIARVFLRNPQILLLDEATASLDSESEYKVQIAINNLLQGRTALIIAHRLNTVLNADRIIVLDKGRIIGEGTHEELLKHNIYYQKIVEQQFKYKVLIDEQEAI